MMSECLREFEQAGFIRNREQGPSDLAIHESVLRQFYLVLVELSAQRVAVDAEH